MPAACSWRSRRARLTNQWSRVSSARRWSGQSSMGARQASWAQVSKSAVEARSSSSQAGS